MFSTQLDVSSSECFASMKRNAELGKTCKHDTNKGMLAMKLRTEKKNEFSTLDSYVRIVKRLTAVGVVGNIVLCLFKFAAGFLGGSAAMISDAVHSASDVLATAIAYLGVRIAGRQADEGHPYGHERFECLASLALAFILLASGLGIGYAGVLRILALLSGSAQASVTTAGLWLAFAAAVISIVTKEAMFRYTRYWASKMNSPAFLADAKHHRSDAASSIGALVGIGASLLGFPLGDPLASVVICLFIVKMAWDVAVDSVGRMMDEPCSAEVEEAIRACVTSQDGVQRIDLLRTRTFGSRAYADIEIAVDKHLDVEHAHDIAESVHDSVEHDVPLIKHVMVHVNPA